MSFKPSTTDEERCGRYIELRKRFQEIKNIEDKIMIDSMPISMNYFNKNQV